MLFGPETLLELRENKMLVISFLSEGCRNIVLLLSFERFSFSYRGKVIIKGVSNIISIGYSITIIKEQYSWYTGCYIFQRNKGFHSFSCVLNIVPISFKIFMIIRLFTFLHKSGEFISIFFVVSVKFFFQYRVLLITKFVSNFFFGMRTVMM